jgi:hypothetical protein
MSYLLTYITDIILEGVVARHLLEEAVLTTCSPPSKCQEWQKISPLFIK